ncbi:MAG: amidase family protein [Actinomycetota bacterium]
MESLSDVDLAFAGIAEQARLLRAGTVSSADLVETYLERIERFDPAINAFRTVFHSSARRAAAEADERIRSGETAPLLGVPVAIKDELDIAGRVTRHGTAAFDEPAGENSAHVQKLLDAGAVLLGTTHLPELAICGFTESRSNGETRNPWDLTRTPGGSSGGSAAAVAAGLVGAASASDGGGSIRIPAACTGLVGLLPQRGRISLMPEAEHWFGMSRTGCLTRRTIDTALWLDVAAGPMPGDAHTPPRVVESFVEATLRSPDPLRIGRSVSTLPGPLPGHVTQDVVDAIDRTGTELERLGHTVSPCSPDFGDVANNLTVPYLRGIADHAAQVPHPTLLEARTRGFARMGRSIPKRLLRRALARRDTHAERINAVFDRFDVLMTPVTGSLPVEIGRWEGQGATRTLAGMARAYPFTAVWNYTGQPAIAVPAGLGPEGLPRSVLFVAPPNQEHLLLALAHQLEMHLDWPRHRPF